MQSGRRKNLPERYLPAVDEKRAWDQLPDADSCTHLKRPQ